MINHRPTVVNDGGSSYSAATRIRNNKTVYEESPLYLQTLEASKKANEDASKRLSAVGILTGTQPQGTSSGTQFTPTTSGGTSTVTDEPAQWDWEKNEEVPKPKTSYVSGSSAPKLSTPPKRVQDRMGKEHFKTQLGLNESTLDQYVQEVFGPVGFKRAESRLNRDNIFDTENLTTKELDQMVKEVFGTAPENLAAAGMSAEDQEAFWEREAHRAELRAEHEAKHPPFMVDSEEVDIPDVRSLPSKEPITSEEVAELESALNALEDGELTVEELYAQEPSRFKKWVRYLGWSLENGVAWFSNGVYKILDFVIGKPLQWTGWEDNPFSDLAELSDQAVESYGTRSDAATAAMGDAEGWKYGQSFTKGVGLAAPLGLTAYMSWLYGTGAAGTGAAGKLGNYKIPQLPVRTSQLPDENTPVPAETPKVTDNTVVDPVKAQRTQTINKNSEKGAVFHKENVKVLKSEYPVVEEEITIRINNAMNPKTGKPLKFRADAIALDQDGKLYIFEFKSSDTARLTFNQAKSFALLPQSGGVVVGAGKGIFTNNYPISPTEVIINPYGLSPISR